MTRPYSATLTLVVLALASGCSSKGSAPGAAPGPAHGAADKREAPDSAAAKPANEATAASPAPASEARELSEDEKPALAPARLQIGEPMINGGLDRDIIRRKFQDHEADLQACLAADAPLADAVVVKLSVDARGVVKDVELGEQGEPEDRERLDCILEQIAKWSFAGEATAAATVELKLEPAP